MKKTNDNAVLAGLIVAFGFPAIAWMFFDWRWAVTVFIIGQFILAVAKMAKEKK
jgi:hypothetical protein